MKKRSNRDMIGAVMVMFCFSDFVRSYLPPIGLAAASIDARAFSVAWQQKSMFRCDVPKIPVKPDNYHDSSRKRNVSLYHVQLLTSFNYVILK